MLFDSHNYFIESNHEKKIKYVGHRTNNVYMINLDKTSNHVKCFLSKEDELWL